MLERLFFARSILARAAKHNAETPKTPIQIVHLPVDGLHEDPNNARVHNDRNLSAIKASLAHFGQQKPIVVDENGVVIAGNGTLAAAKALGWQTIAAVRSDLTDENSKRAFAIADNRTAELAEWDFSVLGASLDALNGTPGLLDVTAFSVDEMMKMLGDVPEEIEAGGVEPRKTVTFEASAAAQGGEQTDTGHVRMVQLFFDDSTHPLFLDYVKVLAERHGTDNITDTVFAALEAAAQSVS